MTVWWAKPTLDDIARGEEKRKAAKQAEERDTFAAAALTGLLSNVPRYQLAVLSRQAYEIADEMMQSRSHEESDGKRTNFNMDRTIDSRAYDGDLVSRLRNWRGLHLAHGGQMYDEAADEIERLRPTDAERAALHWFAHYGLPEHRAATLRNLLERLK